MSELFFSSLSKLPEGFEFHHVGYATTSLVKEKEFFTFLGYKQEGEDFTDQVQGITGCFLVGHGPRIELLESLPESKTLAPWLDAGIKIYHFAYLVNDILEALRWASSQRGRVTVPPVPSVAFSGNLISFVIFRNGLMVEFIEKTK